MGPQSKEDVRSSYSDENMSSLLCGGTNVTQAQSAAYENIGTIS